MGGKSTTATIRAAVLHWWRRMAGLRIINHTGATVSVELAFALPIVAGLLMSGVEVTRFVLINQKLERTAATMGDLITRMPELTEGDITSLFQASDQVMTPYDVVADGRVIVSSMIHVGGAAQVTWQRTYGLAAAASHLGGVGDTAVLPGGLIVREDENVVAAEVFYDFKPILIDGLLSARRLYASALMRPRFGNLATVLP